MRVLHLGKFYPPVKGGMETMLELMCEYTSSQIENSVICANDRCALNEERRGSTDVIRLPAIARIGAVAVCPTMPWRLARADADLIVLHEPNPMALLAYFLARPSTTLLVWFHSEVIRPSWRYKLFYRPFLQFALRRAARIVATSPTLAASSPVLTPWHDKCVVIPFGIDERAPSEQVLQRAAAVREAEARPIVLFVGRLVPYKGVDVLLEAMRAIPAVALLVGEGPEGPALRQSAEALGVADRVRFLGEVSNDELAALYRACDLLVLPSVTRQEAFGVVLLEAMACGKPVVSTDLGTGTGWVNQDRETGFVVAPRDPAALHEAISRLVAEPELRELLGDGARRRARSLFALDRMIESILALYRQASDTKLDGRAA
ncbi:MAG TPA: glycosyltransferase [Vicinamibacterales bacterium]|nr:glycosyltransferase [Vicinamibacterales bacterium]